MTQDHDTFRGVTLNRCGLVALLAQDAQSVVVFDSREEGDPPEDEWADLLAELQRCGLPNGVDVADEWADVGPTGVVWVTVYVPQTHEDAI